jgi:chaperonin GroES
VKELKPIGNRVLIKPIPEEEKKTEGGIVIPVTVKQNVAKGKVIEVGEVKWLHAGDTILYSVSAGTEVEVGGERHLLMFEDPHEILAVI